MRSKKLVKQVNNKPKRDSKGRLVKGSTANPNGRPPKGQSITEIMRNFLDSAPKNQEVTYKEILVRKVYKMAVEDNNITAIKLIWNYIDGMPVQKNVIESEKPISELLDEIEMQSLETDYDKFAEEVAKRMLPVNPQVTNSQPSS